MKKYIKVMENPMRVTHLRIETHYDLGGYNVFNGKDEPRGYYLSVRPVEVNGVYETAAAFCGIRQCIKPVSRKSKNAENAAEEMAALMIDDLVKFTIEKNGLKLE